MSTTLSLFSEFDTPQATGKTAVLVRSHLRHVKGSEASPKGSERPLPPHNCQPTSKAAALAVQSQQATQLDRVLEIITKAGERGTTRSDVSRAMGLPQSTICARVYRLIEQGRATEPGDSRLPDCGGSVRQKIVKVKLCPAT